MRRFYRILARYLVVMGALITQTVWAKSPYTVNVQHFSLGEGLPNRAVLTINQDHQGFIWLGTLDNAYRFDGFSFLPLPAEHAGQPGSVAPVIRKISSDTSGNLWFFKIWSGSNAQIEILRPGFSKPITFQKLFHRPLPFDLPNFVFLPLFPRLPNHPKDPIVIPNSNGAVWIYQSLGRFNQLYQHPVPASPKNILLTPAGTIVLTYPSASHPFQNELIELYPTGKIRRQLNVPGHLCPIGIDSQGVLYLSYCNNAINDPVPNSADPTPRLAQNNISGLLYSLSIAGKLEEVPVKFKASPFPKSRPYRFTGDKMVYDARHNLFWFMGKNVLFAWHPEHGIVFDLAASGFPIASLIGINDLFFDRTGAVWVGTHNGVLLLTLEANPFYRHLYTPDHQIDLPKFTTRGIVKTGDWLWVNSNGGQLLHLKSGLRRRVLPNEQMAATLGHDHRIWTVSDSLTRVDLISGQMEKFPLQPNNYGWTIRQDGNHNFWLGHDRGLAFFDVTQKRMIPFTRYNQYPELATSRVNGIFPGPNERTFWITASTGLYLLNTQVGITARYSSRDPSPRSLPFDHITFLHADRQQAGIYWLATRGGGLIRWERSTGTWQQFTREQGLSNDNLYSLHEDRHGRLWIPSDYGLMRFGKKTHQVQLYLPKDGITHEEFNLSSSFQDPDGDLFLGGLNGITSFRPDDQIPEKPYIVPLVVTRHEQLNAETGQKVDQLQTYLTQGDIIVPPENRAFSMSFALLDYRYSRQFRLVYRITGWQDYWTGQLNHDLSMNGLPPGSYLLQVRAQNPNGQWVSQTMTIPITILKPFYQQTWFLLLLALALIAATFAFFQWRNHRLRLEKQRLEQEVERRTQQIANDKALIEQQTVELQASARMKDRFFANVSHELRTPLTLLLGPLTYLSKHFAEPGLAQLVSIMDRNARQLLTMVNDILELSKSDDSTLELEEHSANVTERLLQTVNAFLPQAQFREIDLRLEGETHPLWTLFDAVKFETVLKNLLSNALKFTPGGGTVTVQVQPGPDWIRIEVADTGSGIHPDDLPRIFERYYQSQQPDALLQGGTGIGLALSAEYCRLWGSQLQVESIFGQGSRFFFQVPYRSTSPQNNDPYPVSADLELNSAFRPLPTSDKGPRLLLVEDNSDMVLYLTTLLTPHFQIQIARNGREAWQWLQGRPLPEMPQVILTDLMMPDMDGMALVRRIRQDGTIRQIPILMLTARQSLEVRLQALRQGVADYLTKPFDQQELVVRLENLLERALERSAWLSDSPTLLPSAEASVEDEWLARLQQVILKNLSNRGLQVGFLADAVHVSERQLYRRLKELTGFSPHQYIQEIRMQTAREWLESQKYQTVKEIAYAVGFQDTVYFSRFFLQRFGSYPNNLLRKPT